MLGIGFVQLSIGLPRPFSSVSVGLAGSRFGTGFTKSILGSPKLFPRLLPIPETAKIGRRPVSPKLEILKFSRDQSRRDWRYGLGLANSLGSAQIGSGSIGLRVSSGLGAGA